MTKAILPSLAAALSAVLALPAAADASRPLDTSREITIYTTAKDGGLRLAKTGTGHFAQVEQPLETEFSIFINPEKTHQTLLGIGGAITDASAEVFAKLPKKKQQEFLEAYYDPVKGIGYTWARTTIHSSDFSSASYTYVREGDKDLASFSIAHDRRYRLPLIKRAIAAAGGKLMLFASPWSPPAFMKSNGSMLQGGTLLPAYADEWARYYAKFIKAYENEGVPIWGVTVQNEPMAKQKWESNILTAEDERDFLKNHLGPTLKKEGLGDKHILVWDHNRDLLPHRADTILADPEAAQYVWGIAYHWYETWTGGEPMYRNVSAVRQDHPDKPVLLTEATIENFSPERYQYWPNGEKYGSAIIHDFTVGSVAWTDWNILLDEHGGPNHVGNFCFAPIHADTAHGELIYTPTYYYIGHFAKFIRPGAQRISAASSRSALQTVAFLNPDGKIATVVMNATDQAIDYNLIAGDGEAKLSIPPHAIQTLMY